MGQIASFNGLRFFTALIIVLLHIGTHFQINYPFRCGYLAVELFFILSGFLLAKTYDKLTRDSVAENNLQLCKIYFFRRFMRFWPEYLFAMLLSFACLSIFSSIKIRPFFLNVFMLSGWGGIEYFLTGGWFIPVVLWCGCFLFSLLVFGKDKAKVFILPIIALLCLFCMINQPQLNIWKQLIASTYLSGGTIRGLLAITVGIYTYWGCRELEKYKEIWRPKFVTISLFVGELVCVIGLVHILVFQKKYNVNLFNVYFYASFLIGLLYFRREKLLKFLSWKIWVPLATVSYSWYLVHGAVIILMKKYYLPWIKTYVLAGSVSAVCLSLLLAIFCYSGARFLVKYIKKFALKNPPA